MFYWPISIGLLIAGFICKDTSFMIAAGLFAIADSGLTIATKIKQSLESRKEDTDVRRS